MNEPKELTHVDLFTGVAGFALAAKWAGFRTIAFVEIDGFCQNSLIKNFNAEVVADTKGGQPGEQTQPKGRQDTGRGSEEVITANTKGNGLQGRGMAQQGPARQLNGGGKVPCHTNIKTFDGTRYQGATLLTGGFPCQPFSCAGKRKGKEDDRFIWPEMVRVIKEAKPAWVIGENVTGIVKMELDNCISDLEGEGYEVQPFIIPACATDAKHRRDRVWIVAHAKCCGRGTRGDTSQEAQGGRNDTQGGQQGQQSELGIGKASGDVPDTGSVGRAGGTFERGEIPKETRGTEPSVRNTTQDDANTTVKGLEGHPGDEPRQIPGISSDQDIQDRETGLPESSVCGVADGIPNDMAGFCEWPEENPEVPRVAVGITERTNKLKAYGNSIVPQVAFEIIRCIAMIERGEA